MSDKTYLEKDKHYFSWIAGYQTNETKRIWPKGLYVLQKNYDYKKQCQFPIAHKFFRFVIETATCTNPSSTYIIHWFTYITPHIHFCVSPSEHIWISMKFHFLYMWSLILPFRKSLSICAGKCRSDLRTESLQFDVFSAFNASYATAINYHKSTLSRKYVLQC